jgi:hypothetical protein
MLTTARQVGLVTERPLPARTTTVGAGSLHEQTDTADRSAQQTGGAPRRLQWGFDGCGDSRRTPGGCCHCDAAMELIGEPEEWIGTAHHRDSGYFAGLDSC